MAGACLAAEQQIRKKSPVVQPIVSLIDRLIGKAGSIPHMSLVVVDCRYLILGAELHALDANFANWPKVLYLETQRPCPDKIQRQRLAD